MKLLEKILVPINLEDNLNPQIDTAFELAKKFNSEVTLLSVLPEEAKIPSINKHVVNHIEKKIETMLSSFRAENITIDIRIEYGNEFDKTISIAEEENVNLVLFSNHPDGEEGSATLDILAEKLIRKSEKPIWIVKQGDKHFPEKILCSIDYSDASARALTNAIKIARVFKKELHIINVVELIGNNYSKRFTVDFEQENKRNIRENDEAFKAFLQRFNFIDVNYKTEILSGDTDAEIKKYVKKNNIDLLFMGATGKTFLQRILLGSVTEKIIRELPCAMVVTKSENILNVKIDADISEVEKHIAIAKKLEETGYYDEAIEQLQTCLQKNDLHIPTLILISELYAKKGDKDEALFYKQKIDNILERLWNKEMQSEIRKLLKL